MDHPPSTDAAPDHDHDLDHDLDPDRDADHDDDDLASSLSSLTEAEIEAKYPHRPLNTHATFPFHVLYTKLFVPLLQNKTKRTGVGLRGNRELKPHEVRRNIIETFVKRWRSEVGPDIFPAFRLILCDKDRERNVYHMKEQRIGKLLVKVMKIRKDSDDGYGLLHWKLPGAWSRSAGDFALRCYEIIKKRPMRTTPGPLTIAQVNEMLDRLSQVTGDENQLPIMEEFYNNMCAEELMWLIRIILKQMKVGATEKTFFDAWHPDADTMFNVSSSLRRVCWELYDPDFRVGADEKGVTLMSCFQPQLAQFQKKSLATVIKAMGGQEFWIEEKLDGERMQMHFDNGEFRWWSRKAKEYTHLYGSSFKNGSVSRFAEGIFDKRVGSIILDGEMITWDPTVDCIVGFGTLKTAAIETSNNPEGMQHRPLFRVFDILFLNGQSLLDYSLEDRRKALTGVMTSEPGRIEIHQYNSATTTEEIEAELRQVIASAFEGLVIKNPRSVYRLNDRNDDWVKVKPEYMTEYGESLDCLVVGGYWGTGKRGSILSSYLCALRVDGNALPPGANPMKFYSFFKVGGGFTANDYATIAHNTDGLWRKWNAHPPPDWLELAGGDRHFEKPHMWIHPENSFVVEVKAASIAATDQFRMNQTLRFPRFKRLRPDRDWKTALSIQGFMKLQADALHSAQTKKLDVERRRQRNKRVKKEFTVAGADEHSVPRFAAIPDTLFANHTFYVLTDSSSRRNKVSKPEIEALIKSHGGHFLQNENHPSIHVIGDRNTVKISALKKRGTHDIIHPQWLFDCIAQHERTGEHHLLPLEPRHLFFATPLTAHKAANRVDKYGDSYARDIDAAELRALLEGMPASTDTDTDPALHASFHASLSTQDSDDAELPGWLFTSCVVYIAAPPQSSSYTLAATPILFAGGKVVAGTLPAAAGRGITHVVVDAKTSPEKLREIRSEIAKWSGKAPRVVGREWVSESIGERTLLDEERFGV